jgi:hypothetical protein
LTSRSRLGRSRSPGISPRRLPWPASAAISISRLPGCAEPCYLPSGGRMA